MENVSSERPRPPNTGKRKLRAPEAAKHGKTYAQSVRVYIYIYIYIYIRRPLVGTTAVRLPCCIQSLSTVSVYKSQVRCQWTVSVSSVLYPSFNGSPPHPGPIKYPQKKSGSKLAGRVSLHRRRARASEAQKHWKT